MQWTPDQRRRRRHFHDFAARVIAPGSAGRDRAAAFDRSLWQALADEGFWAARVPAEYGGSGGDLWDFLAGFEGLALGADDCGFVLSAVAHAGFIQLLLDHGTHEQRADLLPRLVGGAVGATAATEPGGGSHVAAITTSAVRRDGGYLLSGSKSHITNAPVADLMLIVGRVPEAGGHDITLFVIDAGQPGVERGKAEELLGQRTSPTGAIEMDHVPVGPDRVIAGVGQGLETLYSFLAFDRLMYGVVAATQLENMIDLARRHVTTRRAFGAPLAEHQFIQDKLVDMKVTLEASRHLAYATVAALLRDDPDLGSLASCTKLTASEGLVRAGTELIQIFGHLGFRTDQGVERYLRDAVAFRIAGGTTEMQKKNIIKFLLRPRPASDPAREPVPAPS
ncbi:acyl-CoA dehydrogenase family protein [Actinomadura kijaniata]|uniref:acyl-CoA dehydrogenase family protein n=1 Tax=Actinomadura kijaniata TaxID=46161 RepID=UPI00082D55DA|nr:acyl-CoA dehydrogenase family protein [Actinomadura kijaniata]